MIKGKSFLFKLSLLTFLIPFFGSFARTQANQYPVSANACNLAIPTYFREVPALFWYNFEGRNFLNDRQLRSFLVDEENPYYFVRNNLSQSDIAADREIPVYIENKTTLEENVSYKWPTLYFFIITPYQTAFYSNDQSIILSGIDTFVSTVINENHDNYAGVSYLDYFNPLDFGASPILQDYRFANLNQVIADPLIGCGITIEYPNNPTISTVTELITTGGLLPVYADMRHTITIFNWNNPSIFITFDAFVRRSTFAPILSISNRSILNRPNNEIYTFNQSVSLRQEMLVPEIIIHREFDKRTKGEDKPHLYTNGNPNVYRNVPLYDDQDPLGKGVKTTVRLAYIDFSAPNFIFKTNFTVYNIQVSVFDWESGTKNIVPITRSNNGLLVQESSSLIDYYLDTTNRKISFYVNRLQNGQIKHYGILLRKLEIRYQGQLLDTDGNNQVISLDNHTYTFFQSGTYEFKVRVNNAVQDYTFSTSNPIVIPELRFNVSKMIDLTNDSFEVITTLTPNTVYNQANPLYLNSKLIRLDLLEFNNDGTEKQIDIELFEIEEQNRIPYRFFNSTINGRFFLFTNEIGNTNPFKNRLFELSVFDINNPSTISYYFHIDEIPENYSLDLAVRDSSLDSIVQSQVEFKFDELNLGNPTYIHQNTIKLKTSKHVKKIQYAHALSCTSIDDILLATPSSQSSSDSRAPVSTCSETRFRELNFKEATIFTEIQDDNYQREFSLDMSEVSYTGNYKLFIRVIDYNGNANRATENLGFLSGINIYPPVRVYENPIILIILIVFYLFGLMIAFGSYLKTFIKNLIRFTKKISLTLSSFIEKMNNKRKKTGIPN